jgi:hypothetical protein
MLKIFSAGFGSFVCFVPLVAFVSQQLGYQDTPMQPNGKWHVHDGTRPQPPIVKAAGPVTTPPPADAIVLLGSGSDLGQWQMRDGGGAVTWAMKDGVLETGRGYIATKRNDFTDVQLHVEFATPSAVRGDGQGRGNSGVYLLGEFEVQVLDSYGNRTYPDGQAAALYGQFPPMVNASLPPGQWQSYDITFTAPRFKGDALESPARITVVHNGVVVHANQAFWGPTEHKLIGQYTPASARGPILLQDHGNPVRYRNIWIRPLKTAE